MSFPTWKDAVDAIEEALSPVTDEQRRFADVAGAELPEDLPRIVAAARLQTLLSGALALRRSHEVSEGLAGLISRLAVECGYTTLEPLDQREGWAWVRYLRLRVRKGALERLQLDRGDVVAFKSAPDERKEQVSSIGADGKVYFKGGFGSAAWPDTLHLLFKHIDLTSAAAAARSAAAQFAEERRRIGGWSEAKARELLEYAVEAEVVEDDVDELESIVSTATDEEPIQRYLEEKPQLLTTLLSGGARFCLRRPSLGSAYVPDFLLSDVDSLGIRWLMVELETPRSPITLVNGNQLEQKARKGVSQVQEWREWLQTNLPVARQHRREGGLGLMDIRPNADGLVLVGRRSLLRDNSIRVRAQIWEQQNILVHTYDWLIESLRGVLRFQGPPGANPHIIHPPHLREVRDNDIWAPRV